jgi:hypothetical protein
MSCLKLLDFITRIIFDNYNVMLPLVESRLCLYTISLKSLQMSFAARFIERAARSWRAVWLTATFSTTVVRIGATTNLSLKGVCLGFGRSLLKPLRRFSAWETDPRTFQMLGIRDVMNYVAWIVRLEYLLRSADRSTLNNIDSWNIVIKWIIKVLGTTVLFSSIRT